MVYWGIFANFAHRYLTVFECKYFNGMKKLFYWLTVCTAVFCIHTSMANPLEKSEEST